MSTSYSFDIPTIDKPIITVFFSIAWGHYMPFLLYINIWNVILYYKRLFSCHVCPPLRSCTSKFHLLLNCKMPSSEHAFHTHPTSTAHNTYALKWFTHICLPHFKVTQITCSVLSPNSTHNHGHHIQTIFICLITVIITSYLHPVTAAQPRDQPLSK